MTKTRILFSSFFAVLMLGHTAFAYALTPAQEHLKKADDLVQAAAKDFAAHNIEAAQAELDQAKQEVEAYDATVTAFAQHTKDQAIEREIDDAKGMIIDPAKEKQASELLNKIHTEIAEQVALF